MQMLSTRGAAAVSPSMAILRGLAPDGGLYVPAQFPQFSLDEIAALADNLVINYKYATLYALEDEIGAKMSFVGNELFESLQLAEIK